MGSRGGVGALGSCKRGATKAKHVMQVLVSEQITFGPLTLLGAKTNDGHR